jgi:hypothetical protein
MSYIHGALCKATNFNVVYIWTYVWQRWKPSLSIYLLHNVSTLNLCRKLSCGTVVCKHIASYQGYPNYGWDLIWYLKSSGYAENLNNSILPFKISYIGSLRFGCYYSAFGKSLCTYERCWKWCVRASSQAWTRLNLFANTFCRTAFGKSLCTYGRCCKWCARATIQTWNV